MLNVYNTSSVTLYCCSNIKPLIINTVSQPGLVSLLGPLPEQQQSLHSLLLSLERQAVVLLDKIGKASANGSVPKAQYGPQKGSKGEAAWGKISGSEKATSDDKLARCVSR